LPDVGDDVRSATDSSESAFSEIEFVPDSSAEKEQEDTLSGTEDHDDGLERETYVMVSSDSDDGEHVPTRREMTDLAAKRIAKQVAAEQLEQQSLERAAEHHRKYTLRKALTGPWQDRTIMESMVLNNTLHRMFGSLR
jgi:hypothetical protein